MVILDISKLVIVVLIVLMPSVSGVNLYAQLGVDNIIYKTYSTKVYSIISITDQGLMLNTTWFNASSTSKIIVTLTYINNIIARTIYNMTMISNQYGINKIKVLDIVKVSVA